MTKKGLPALLLFPNFPIMEFVDEMLVKVNSIGGLSDDELLKFCVENDHMRVERDANGNLIFMSPTYSNTGKQNARIVQAFANWNDKYDKGECFDSSSGFILPDKAMRSPDFSFILHENLKKLKPSQKKGFYKICPDFVLELRSETDLQETLRVKMREYIRNGASLGWLIDPIDKVVVIYDKNGSVTEFKDFRKPLKGKYFLGDFEIVLQKILS